MGYKKSENRFSVPYDCAEPETQILSVNTADFFKVMPDSETLKISSRLGINLKTVV